MRYSTKIKKFFYSQYFFGGLRIALGLWLPAVASLLFLGKLKLGLYSPLEFGFKSPLEFGFVLALGALSPAILDLPGPLAYKTRDMLICTAIGVLSALITGLATASVLALWLTILPLTFILSLLVVYGGKWLQISFAALLMMVLTITRDFDAAQALYYAGVLLLGGLWYSGWSTLISHWQWQRIERQAIAEYVFAVANYLRARARFYEVDTELEKAYQELIACQVKAIDYQEAARDIVLRNLPGFRSGKLGARRIGQFNLFINMVDLHDTVVAAYTDYRQLRESIGSSDLLLFIRDALRKMANNLETVGLAVLEGMPVRSHLSVKAELRALEYEIELLRKQEAPQRRPETYAVVVAIYRRIWSAARLIEKMHRNIRPSEIEPVSEIRIDQTLSRFLSVRSFSPGLILSNLNMDSPSFRHALRMTITVAVGLLVTKLLPLNNSYWITMTAIIILKPGFSLTRQRNVQRLAGTIIGCMAVIVLLLTVKSTAVLLVVMFVCTVMCYSLLLNYGASVAFTSIWVLLLIHLFQAKGWEIIGVRAFDTFIGSLLALGASFLFPYWEYRLMGGLVKTMLEAMRKYFDVVCVLKKTGSRVELNVTDAVSQDTSSSSPDSGQDHNQRLTRKNAYNAFANLGNAFGRMMLEPKSKQRCVPELNDLLVQSYALAAQITAVAPLFSALTGQPLAHQFILEPVQRSLQTIRDNLSCPEDRPANATLPVTVFEIAIDSADSDRQIAAPPLDAPAAGGLALSRELSQMLDKAVVSVETQQGLNTETVQEVKLLAHQCKQMIRTSLLIQSRVRPVLASL